MAEVIVIVSSDEESYASNSNVKNEVSVNDHPQNECDIYPVPSSSLVVNENESFHNFISTCKQYINDPNGLKILSRLSDMYDEADPNCKGSSVFKKIVMDTETKLKSNPKNIYVFITELYDEVKSWKKNNVKVKKEEEAIAAASQQEIAKDTPHDQHQRENEVESAEEAKRNRQIRKLEKLLRLLSKKIKKLQEQELNLDDLDKENSTYLEEDRYKARFVKVWDKLCSIQNCSSSTGRCTQKKFVYEGSRYPEINKKISKYINKYKEFPEFADVLELIRKVAEKERLNLKSQQIHSIAETTFSEVGETLRRRRIVDFADTLLDAVVEQADPADHDEQLAAQLEESRLTGEKRIEKVLQEYAEKQLNMTPEETEKSQKEEEEEEKLDNTDTTVSRDEENSKDEDETEESDDKFDIDTISHEFQEELENGDERTDESSAEETEEDDSDSDSSDQLPSRTASLKRPLELPGNDEPSCKRESRVALYVDDIIVLD